MPSDYTSLNCSKEEYSIITKPISDLKKWISSEIIHVKELLESSLKNKNYGNFKILSQSDLMLKWIHNRINDSRIL